MLEWFGKRLFLFGRDAFQANEWRASAPPAMPSN
jgi:hypothetical protein